MKEKNNKHSPEFLKEFGDRLKDLRIKRGYTINELCEELNIHRSTYSSWEYGSRFPLGKSLIILADILETTTSYLNLETDEINSVNDIKDMLTDDSLKKVWDGKEINEEQAKTIAALINAYLNQPKV